MLTSLVFLGNRNEVADAVICVDWFFEKFPIDILTTIPFYGCSQLILQSINTFFVHLLSSYAGMRVFLHQATPQQTVNAGLYLSWSLYFLFFVCQTILYLAALRHQKSILLGIVHRSLNLPQNEFLIDRFHQLSEQITSRAPHITFFFFELHPLIIVQVDHPRGNWDDVCIHFGNYSFSRLAGSWLPTCWFWFSSTCNRCISDGTWHEWSKIRRR